MVMAKCALVWFRNNLRLDDNESLVEAAKVAPVVPIYVFDERIFKGSTHTFGFRKTDVHRVRFTIEAVQDLRDRLRAIGSDLVVRIGIAEDVLAEFAAKIESGWVYCNRERTSEEVAVQDALEPRLWALGQELRYNRGKLLYHTADLPFPVAHLPDTFTQFRKEIERFVPLREPIAAPTSLQVLPEGVDPGRMPTLADFGLEDLPKDPRAAIEHVGGETAGLARLQHYLWGSDAARSYKLTRDGMVGADYSTKFSAWLAQGCLSPKRIMHELRRYERERGANESTYWIYFELLWRDYFRLVAKKYRNAIFHPAGPKGGNLPPLNQHRPTFERWAEGRTGVPFIDASMRELNASGFMSNRGRQNTASFLVKDLKLDWRMGAEYFESMLIDHDVASNYGNWNYVAGVGADPREDRYFNILSQATRYDGDGAHARRWLPELSKVPDNKIHRPDLLTTEDQRAFEVQLGVDYPYAMVDIAKWDPGNYTDRGSRGKDNGGKPRGSSGKHGGRRQGVPSY